MPWTKYKGGDAEQVGARLRRKSGGPLVIGKYDYKLEGDHVMYRPCGDTSFREVPASTSSIQHQGHGPWTKYKGGDAEQVGARLRRKNGGPLVIGKYDYKLEGDHVMYRPCVGSPRHRSPSLASSDTSDTSYCSSHDEVIGEVRGIPRGEPNTGRTIRLVMFSDTHLHHEQVRFPSPAANQLVLFSGDFAQRHPGPLEGFVAYLRRRFPLPIKIVMVFGNHDKGNDASHPCLERYQIILLRDEHVTVCIGECQVRIFGVDYHSPDDYDYGLVGIPKGMDIVLCHRNPVNFSKKPSHAASRSLYQAILSASPRVCVFGHEHQDGGRHTRVDHTTFWCAAVVGKGRKIARSPSTMDLLC